MTAKKGLGLTEFVANEEMLREVMLRGEGWTDGPLRTERPRQEAACILTWWGPYQGNESYERVTRLPKEVDKRFSLG